MGLLTRSRQIRWWRAVNGQLTHKTDENIVLTASGYAGIIRGVRIRIDQYENIERTVIDVLLEDEIDSNCPLCVVTGTLRDHAGNITVYGRLLLARLAYPACMERKGQPVELRVFPARNNDRITCCTIADPETHEPLDAYDTGADALPTDQLHGVINEWIATAINHYGTFGRETTTPPTLIEPAPDTGSNEMALPF
jgi:hypothetical protein